MLPLAEKINPKHTALLVIDIQNDFASPTGSLGRGGRDLSMVEPMIDRLQDLTETAKHAGVLTLYTQELFDRSKLNDLQKEQYDLDGKGIVCDIAADGWHFYRIDPPPEAVFEKYVHDPFSNPRLVQTLHDHGIKTLIVTGLDTIYCVEYAIRNGFDRGYKIVVPEDLVAGNARHIHWQQKTLELTRKTFGCVTTAAEIKRIWQDLT